MGSAILALSVMTSLLQSGLTTSSSSFISRSIGVVLHETKFRDLSNNKNTASIFDLKTFLPAPPFILSGQVADHITAEAVLIKELGGRVLYERQATESRPIASLTKLMTASVAMKQYPEVALFTITKEVVATEGETGEFSLGERFPRNTLIKAALISSSNDASVALATKIETALFVQHMNELAKELGMTQTFFVDPTGLASTNRSSLIDLSTLVAYISRNQPEILDWSIKNGFMINGKTRRRLVNLDYLLPRYLDIIRGSKTGSTEAAGECLVLVLKWKNSPPVFLGLLNSKNRFADAERLIGVLDDFYNQ